MKSALLILAFIFCSSVHAEYDYNDPRYTLLDKDRKPIEGVTQSTTDTRCIHKASKQPSGTYYCSRGPIKIVVRKEFQEPQMIMASFTITPPNAYIENEYTPDPNTLNIDEIDELRVYINNDPFVSLPGSTTDYSISGKKGEGYTIYVTAVVNGKEGGGNFLTGIFK